MTSHLDDRQLIDYCGGEAAGREAFDQHLSGCPECRARCESLRQVLRLAAALPVPEPHPSFESRLWLSVRPQLAPHASRLPWRQWFTLRRLLPVGAVAALTFAAFLAGRYSLRPAFPVAPAAAQSTPQVRERILLLAVGDHLDRAQSVLLEISNSDPASSGGAVVDFSREQLRAQQLLASNRLYRQTASQTGDSAVATVLNELEPLLVEIANSPGQVSPADLEELRRRIAARGLLLKVRVMGSTVRERQSRPDAKPAGVEPGKS